jgi:hypothetical protein
MRETGGLAEPVLVKEALKRQLSVSLVYVLSNAPIVLAAGKSRGVYVVNGGKVLSPLNLKYERIGSDGFRKKRRLTPHHPDLPRPPLGLSPVPHGQGGQEFL